jgi:hypothetical protein
MRRQIPALVRSRLVVAVTAALALSGGVAAPAGAAGPGCDNRPAPAQGRGNHCDGAQAAPVPGGDQTAGGATGRKIG